MAMHNPSHPGETLLEDVLPELNISIAELARRLGFARETLSRIRTAGRRSAGNSRHRQRPHLVGRAGRPRPVAGLAPLTTPF